MKFNYTIFSSTLLLLAVFLGCKSETTTRIEVPELEVHFMQNVDAFPRITWKAQSSEPGYQQSAFQLLVSDTQKDIDRHIGNVWDSGQLETDQSLLRKFSEIDLKPGNKYFFKVKVWNDGEEGSNWSKVVKAVAPINYPEDWKGKWITYDYDPKAPLPIFRKQFSVSNKVKSARLYIAGPSFYEAYLNGKKIGENVLDPGQTNYEDYTFYTAYDIEPDALATQNVLGVMLGNGWYNQNQVWKAPDEEYSAMAYGQPTFIAQLVLSYEDGKKEVLATDESWNWKSGPITYSNIYGGETYNATLETNDWLAFDASMTDWNPSLLADNHPTELFEQFAEPIKRMGELEVKKVTEAEGGKYIFDFGQNFAGWAKLKIQGKKGQEVTIRFAEEIDSLGNLDPASTGVYAIKLVQTSKYICNGDGVETWEPRFTYHGFRYAEVSGLTEKPNKDLLTGVVVYSSVDKIGSFASSEDNLNRLHELANWSITSNIHSIPTDCPHRERCGWTGDAHALAQSLLFNYDAPRFLTKYILDMRSSGRHEKEDLYFGESFMDRSIIMKPKGIPTMVVPGKRSCGIASPDWGTAMVQLPWYLYLYQGDKEILEEFYMDMKTWVDYIHAKNVDGTITHGLGDWCPPGGNVNIDCPVPVSSSAFHILDVSLMSRIAKVLGKAQDATDYSAKLGFLIDSFNREFYNEETGSYGSQTGNTMALEIGIVPEENKTKVAAAIVKNIHEAFDGFVNTGIFGIGRIFKVLCENGYQDEAYRLLSKKDNPSFAVMWNHYDATTLWEALPTNENYDHNWINERSHNHPMQAGYDSWFYSGIAGINPDPTQPGFKRIIFKPYLTGYLKHTSATYESVFGEIKSEWETSGESFSWKITIPENSTGEIWAPTDGKKVQITVNGELIAPVMVNNQFSKLGNYSSGDYIIKITKG